MEESQRLLNNRTVNTNNQNLSSSEEEWSNSLDEENSSYYSDTDSSEAEWESQVDDSGHLLYVVCHPFVTQNNVDNEKSLSANLKKDETRKSTRGKFLRLIRRRESKRKSKRSQKHHDSCQESKVTFQDYVEGEIKEVKLKIGHDLRHRLGRRAGLSESILGLSVSTFSDGIRIMVAGFPAESQAKKERSIKIGDWLKSINDTEVTANNLNSILENLRAEEVTLTLQRVAVVEVTKEPPTNELCSQSRFVKYLKNIEQDEKDIVMKLILEQPAGIVFLNTENLTENGPEYEGVIYTFPTPMKSNLLCQVRGIFITANHLLNNITKTKPHVTSFIQKHRLVHVVYTTIDSKLLLLMFPDNRVNLSEILLLNAQILRTLRFLYSTIENSFSTTNKEEVDHFFMRLFACTLTDGLWTNGERNLAFGMFKDHATSQGQRHFELAMPTSHFLTLPNEAQMQIDDALSELEASDYREWNEDPLDCQRLFTILGSAFYHDGYLLASHFIHDDLMDIHGFSRLQGLFKLSRTEPVKSLVIWREVFPKSCTLDFVTPPSSKRYLLVVGNAKDLLAVIMEAGGCTEPAEDNIGPEAFYVEEVQATLAHLQELGMNKLADRWANTNPGSQVVVPQAPRSKRMSDILGNIGNILGKEQSPSSPKQKQSPQQTEVTSILKRRSSEQNLQASNTMLPTSEEFDVQWEDSVSQGGYSEKSEHGDEPVLGRRVLRERGKNNFDDSDEENSDFDDYRDGSQKSNSSFDLTDTRGSVIIDSCDRPMQLNVGDDITIFHYVQLDTTEGILLAPPECNVQSATLDCILDNFRLCCQRIHAIFQKTLRFKNTPAQELTKSLVNKSLIAIKEHGTLFECPYRDENTKKSAVISYWVVGRLFHMPHPKELYVCYKDTIPQNLVEIAFNLGISVSG